MGLEKGGTKLRERVERSFACLPYRLNPFTDTDRRWRIQCFGLEILRMPDVLLSEQARGGGYGGGGGGGYGGGGYGAR